METLHNTPLNELFDKIKEVKICMLSTIDENNRLRSRPMATTDVNTDDNELWFFTKDTSEKANEISISNEVNLSYADTGNNLYVSVSGTASVVNEKEKIQQLWKPIYKAWFPEGLNDPEIALLKIKPSKAEYWDSTSSKMVQLFGFAKAVLTGKEYAGEGSEHRKITL